MRLFTVKTRCAVCCAMRYAVCCSVCCALCCALRTGEFSAESCLVFLRFASRVRLALRFFEFFEFFELLFLLVLFLFLALFGFSLSRESSSDSEFRSFLLFPAPRFRVFASSALTSPASSLLSSPLRFVEDLDFFFESFFVLFSLSRFPLLFRFFSPSLLLLFFFELPLFFFFSRFSASSSRSSDSSLARCFSSPCFRFVLLLFPLLFLFFFVLLCVSFFFG
jgi:hypothetical protein